MVVKYIKLEFTIVYNSINGATDLALLVPLNVDDIDLTNNITIDWGNGDKNNNINTDINDLGYIYHRYLNLQDKQVLKVSIIAPLISTKQSSQLGWFDEYINEISFNNFDFYQNDLQILQSLKENLVKIKTVK